MLLVLIFMFFLGPLQIIWAFFGLIASPYRLVRKHFIYYFIGVAVYFSIVGTLDGCIKDIESSNLYAVYFFGGAFVLAIYHLLIVVKKGEFF